MSNVLGIIFANTNEEKIPELTSSRTMGSVPFGGKYRLIDFPLSNMTNSGIDNVGIIVQRNYFSLMDHVGAGSAWDLSKRRSGLTVLPPYGGTNYESQIEALYAVSGYLNSREEEYVLFSNTDAVINIDYAAVYQNHIKNRADITVVYKQMEVPEKMDRPLTLDVDDNNRVKGIYINQGDKGFFNLSIGSIMLKKDLLFAIIKECISRNSLDIKRVLQDCAKRYIIYGHEHKGEVSIISSINEYFDVNMSLKNSKIRQHWFDSSRPIYTKIRDDIPTRYGLESVVKNSLIAQGCVIEGEVDSCVLFKGVKIGKGTKLSNCIVMQDTKIGENVSLNYVIIDKDVTICNERSMSGYKSYPIYISKRSVV